MLERHPIAALVAGILAILLLCLIGWGVSVGMSDLFGKGNAYKQVHGDATYRRTMHDQFYEKCADIQAAEGRRDLAKQQLKQDLKAGMDADTISRDRQNVSGPEGQRLTLITTYNADADNVQNKGLFRDIRLPAHIDASQEHTKCAS